MLYWDNENGILTYDLTGVALGITKHRLNGRDLTVRDVFQGDYASFANLANFRFIFISVGRKTFGPVTAHHASHLPVFDLLSEPVITDTILVMSDEVPEELAMAFGMETEN